MLREPSAEEINLGFAQDLRVSQMVILNLGTKTL